MERWKPSNRTARVRFGSRARARESDDRRAVSFVFQKNLEKYSVKTVFKERPEIVSHGKW